MTVHVVYVGWAGSGAPPVAAAVHLGLMPGDRPPRPEELRGLPGFGEAVGDDHGRLRYVGTDARGRRVYTLSARAPGPVMVRALLGLAAAAGLDPGRLYPVDASAVPGTWWRLFRGLAGVPGLRALGEWLGLVALRRSFPELVRLAERGRAAPPARPVPEPAAGDGGPRVVYYCYGGVHTSVVAAAIHLGRLPRDRVPDAGEILSLPAFDPREAPPLGSPRWLGRDAAGVPVGSLGLGPCRRLAAGTVRGALRALGADVERLILVPVLERTGWLVRVGGLLSRRLGVRALGARLVAEGIRRSYPALAAAVRGAEARARVMVHRATAAPGAPRAAARDACPGRPEAGRERG